MRRQMKDHAMVCITVQELVALYPGNRMPLEEETVAELGERWYREYRMERIRSDVTWTDHDGPHTRTFRDSIRYVEAFGGRPERIVARVGSWGVTRNGLESLVMPYSIDRGRLYEDWFGHMSQKRWVNIHEFGGALWFARKYHGVDYGVVP